MQKHLFSLYDPLNPDQEWEVHVSAKFTGAKYPHGNPKEPNGLFFDRMILVRVENPRSGDEGRGQKAAMQRPWAVTGFAEIDVVHSSNDRFNKRANLRCSVQSPSP